MLAKLVGFIMRVWTPLLGVFFSLAMSVMYAVSVYGQMGPDHLDPAMPSPMAWYIRYGCWPAVNFPNNALGSCRMAVGSYAVTVYMLAVYLACLAFAVWNMVPTAAEKEEARLRRAEMKGDDASSENGHVSENKVVFEMVPPHQQQQPQQHEYYAPHQQGPFTPGPYTPSQHGPFTPGPYTPAKQGQFTPGPYTPRTQAFNPLDRRLPLRGE